MYFYCLYFYILICHVLVGMSGVLLVQRLALRDFSSQAISHELSTLHSSIKELQQEIRQIKKPPLK